MPSDAPLVRPANLGATAETMVATARAILAGSTGLPRGRQTRAAALFARTALELIVDERLLGAGIDVGALTMRSKLICLRICVDATVGQQAVVAWAGLSHGCHHHAYELSPTWSEVTHLVDVVDDLVG